MSDRILVDEEDRDLLYRYAWHLMPGGHVAHCIGRPTKANIYLKDLIWQRMGNTGKARCLDGDPLHLRRSNLGPKTNNFGRRHGVSVINPSPLTHLGLGRHQISQGFYEICEAEPPEPDRWKHTCIRRNVGYARRTPQGWRVRENSSQPWSAPFDRFYDAVSLLCVEELAS